MHEAGADGRDFKAGSDRNRSKARADRNGSESDTAEASLRHRTRDDGLSHDHVRFDDRPPDDRVSHNRLPGDNDLSPACSDALPAMMATAAALCACCFRQQHQGKHHCDDAEQLVWFHIV